MRGQCLYSVCLETWITSDDSIPKRNRSYRWRGNRRYRSTLGEYGNICQHEIEVGDCPCCNVGRPHYHAILFNCNFSDLQTYTGHISLLDSPRLTSPMLESIWQYGFVDVGEVNFESAAYVARYAMKKQTGVAADHHYTGH